jgi:hypothetical protein
MTGPLATLKNRLLSALPSEDRALLAPHLSTVDLEKGRLLYEPGDLIDHVYFPQRLRHLADDPDGERRGDRIRHDRP